MTSIVSTENLYETTQDVDHDIERDIRGKRAEPGGQGRASHCAGRVRCEARVDIENLPPATPPEVGLGFCERSQ